MAELPDEPTVSVVLCTYDPGMYEHFRETAESVLDQTYERVELIVVVDGSDEVFERVKSDYSGRGEIVLHKNGKNVGLLKSRNRGVDLTSGDVVAFIDDDAAADDDWVEELVSSYVEHDAFAVGGKMMPKWVVGKPTFLPEEFYWLVGVTHRGFAQGPREVRNTFGSNLSFRRDVFCELGGFDVGIGGRKGDKHLQGGETELCARLQSHYGEGVWYNPDAIVSHKVFKHRTNWRWLVNRAFWQGYSKRAMAELVPESGTEERDFLKRILVEFVPHRVKQLVSRPSFEKGVQLGALFVFTGVVGAGYIYGAVRW